MSQENVEVVSAFLEESLRDPEQRGSRYLAGECEFHPFSHPHGPARGPAGFRSRVAELAAQFDTYEVRPDRLEQVGELVVAELRREARSKRGPAMIRDRFSQVFTVHDGKIVRVDSFSTFREAFKAAALSEAHLTGGENPEPHA